MITAMKLRKLIVCLTLCVNTHTCLRFGYRFYLYGRIIPDILTASSLLIGLILVDICKLKPSNSHSPFTLFVQYAAQKLFLSIGNILYFRLEKMSRNVESHQKDVLLNILNQNRNTVCAKSFGMCDINNITEFVSKVPLTTYANYESFAELVEESGDNDIFFPGKADYIALTSGTTSGKSKKFPKSLKIMKRTMGKWLCLAQKMFLHVPKNHFLRKWLAIKIKPRIFYSKSAIRCGPISGLASDLSMNYYVFPKDLSVESNEETVIYINLLFGLLEEEIANLFFSTSQIALLFFKILERNWAQLCDDIERGVFSLNNDLPCEQRTNIEKHLNGGDSVRANFLRREFALGMKSIVPRIWPSCPGLFCLATGSFITQANLLKEEYLGHLPIFSPFHAGTETVYGVNVNLEETEVTYLAMTPYNFFEFIPVEDIGSDCPRTLLAHEVEDGAMYEMVVTTYEGLYRYRTEDMVQINGFYGTIPKYKFMSRSGDILSACNEHVPEMLVSDAMRSVATKWNRPLMEFTSTECVHVEQLTGEVTGLQYYVTFVELSCAKACLTEEQITMVDEELRRLHEMYSMFRSSNRMQAIRIVEVESGTFDAFRRYYLTLNPAISGMQYKLPRIIRSPECLKFLLNHRRVVDERQS